MRVLAIYRGDGSGQEREFPSTFIETSMFIKVLSFKHSTSSTNLDRFRQVKSDAGNSIESVVTKSLKVAV
jgi:hypothetical protein